MRKLSLILACLVVLSIVGACAVIKHSSFYPGASSDEILAKLGPPTRVHQSAGGVEVWEYKEDDLVGKGSFYYYIKNGKVIKKDLITP